MFGRKRRALEDRVAVAEHALEHLLKHSKAPPLGPQSVLVRDGSQHRRPASPGLGWSIVREEFIRER